MKISIEGDKKHGKTGAYALPREHINLWDLLPRHGYIQATWKELKATVLRKHSELQENIENKFMARENNKWAKHRI